MLTTDYNSIIPFAFWLHLAGMLKMMQSLLDSENQQYSYNTRCEYKSHTEFKNCTAPINPL